MDQRPLVDVGLQYSRSGNASARVGRGPCTIFGCVYRVASKRGDAGYEACRMINEDERARVGLLGQRR